MRTCSPTTCSSSATALSGLIDFYFACTDAFAYDLAICLNAWCFSPDGTYHRDMGAALIAGYEAVRPLETAEVEALPILCRGAALRFMLTRRPFCQSTSRVSMKRSAAPRHRIGRAATSAVSSGRTAS